MARAPILCSARLCCQLMRAQARPTARIPRSRASFTSPASGPCGELAREAGVDFSVAEDATFFEKSNPNATETGCELGVPRGELQTKRFTLHRRHFAASFAARRKLAET